MKQAGKFWVPDHETVQIEQLTNGGWQMDHLEAALAHVKTRRVAVDGGAHVGSWTFAMLERGFQIVQAFEPAPDTFECLLENTKEWRIAHMTDVDNRFVGLHKCALGEEPNKMGMKDDTKYDGGNTGGRYLKGGGNINVRPLDIYKWLDIDFIKLDLEGYEPYAIRGARETILRCKPVVMIEDKHRMAHRYNFVPGFAGTLLEEMGMLELGSVGNNRIFGWTA